MYANVVALVECVGWFAFLAMVMFALACHVRAR
jgi:hypothetical protein